MMNESKNSEQVHTKAFRIVLGHALTGFMYVFTKGQYISKANYEVPDFLEESKTS